MKMRIGLRSIVVVVVFLIVTLVSGWIHAAEPAKWYPFKVQAWYGNYDPGDKEPGKPAPSLTGPKTIDWVPPAKAKKPWIIGVSFPHLKDPSWVAGNFGVYDEAKRLGVEMRLVAAEGYTAIDQQVRQIEDLVSQGVNAILLAAISYTASDKLVEEITKKGIPVVAMINDIRAPAIAAKSINSFFKLGYQCGEFVLKDSEGKKEVNVVLLPGPAGAGWSPESATGFTEAVNKLAPGRVKILDTKWGDPGKAEQLRLLENSLQAYAKIDYIIGNAVAIDVGTEILAEKGLTGKVKLVSTYLTAPLYDKVVKGTVAGSAIEGQPYEGRIAVDQAVLTLEGGKPGFDFPFRIGPDIPFLHKGNVKQYTFEYLLGPRNFRPTFNYKP